nr:putative F-box/FBD/LRR-repeat protein At4g00315 isoform X1 [Setaria viridis]
MPSRLERGQAQEQENKWIKWIAARPDEQHHLQITMGTDSEGDIAGGCRGSGTDHFSGLPDHLLHSILLRLPGTADAARTSVLARRWHDVWAQLPELSLSTAQGHAAVDATLAAHSAPTVRRLEIKTPPQHNSSWWRRADIPTDRVSSWLDFASLHLAGELRLDIPYCTKATDEAKAEEIVLPLCERVTAIFLALCSQTMMQFRLPPAGVFSALATLGVANVCVDGQELEDVLCSRCPWLKQLVLYWITLRDGAHVPSIRSDSLERLEITASQFQVCLQIATPELQTFYTLSVSDFHIAAPKLSEVNCKTSTGYDPSRHHFTESGHHLQRLVIAVNYGGLQLMLRF